MSLMLRFTARSHVGRVREGNEDSGYAGARLLVVADGMGGHAAGEVASAAAISAMTDLDTVNVTDPRASLREAVREADRRLQILVEDDAAREGMGTTLTALLWDGQAFTVAHLGDSRAYFLRDGLLGQITHDHTFVQTLVDEGRISADEADHHPQRSLILRVLDGRGRSEPDLDVIEARDGDRFLVCSDGLSGFVSLEEMTAALGTGDIETAADRLIELALDAGAPDNVTCVIGEVYDSDDTGVLPLTGDGAPDLAGVLVGAAAEPDAPWSAAASRITTERPDRRLLDPEEDSDENEAELARYAPQEPSRWRWARRVVILLVAVGIVSGIAYAAQQWTETQYYVGVEDEQVAIYQGLDQQIVGLSLSSVYEVLDVPVEMLPTFDRAAIEDSISADSLDDARSIANRLSTRAAACERFRTQAGEGGGGSGSGTGTDEPATTEPATTPPSTSPRGPTTAPETSTGGSGGGGSTSTATAPAGDQPTEGATTTTDETSPETTESPTESGEPNFDDPVTREECGVGGS